MLFHFMIFVNIYYKKNAQLRAFLKEDKEEIEESPFLFNDIENKKFHGIIALFYNYKVDYKFPSIDYRY